MIAGQDCGSGELIRHKEIPLYRDSSRVMPCLSVAEVIVLIALIFY
jgi:hypothetical protein